MHIHQDKIHHEAPVSDMSKENILDRNELELVLFFQYRHSMINLILKSFHDFICLKCRFEFILFLFQMVCTNKEKREKKFANEK